MAVAFGDRASGFRHNEVIRFINNEVLLNGGGPEFYVALRSRPWSEVEDRLCIIVADPNTPRALKRACAWSGLALGVRVAARQREQQARWVQRLQDQMDEHEATSWALALELQLLREERDAAAAQLSSTRTALQQVMDECEVLRGRLLQVERSAQANPLPQNNIPVPGADQYYGAAAWPLGAGQQREVVASGRVHDMLHVEAQVPAPESSPYVPRPPGPWDQAMQPYSGPPGPWNQAMQPYPGPPGPWDQEMQPHSGPPGAWNQAVQPHLQMPVPLPFPINAPFPVGLPCPTPLPSSVVMESEGIAATAAAVTAVAPQMPPAGIYPPGLWIPVGPQSCHGQGEYAENLQGQCHPEDSRSHSQKEDSECPQGTAPLGDSSSQSQKEDPIMPQGMAPKGNSSSQSQKEDPIMPQGTTPLGDSSNQSQKEDFVMPQGTAPLGDVSSCRQKGDPMMPQETAPFQDSQSQSQKKGPESPQATPPGDSRSHGFRKHTKKELPPRFKAKPPEGRKAFESQQGEKPASQHSQLKWVCSWCKAMNLAWRKACYKCKKAFIPVEHKGVDPGQTH